MTGDETTVEQLLASCPEFAGLPSEARAQLARRGRVVTYEAGEWVMREGEPGDALYVVLSGRVEVVVGSGSERVLTSLKRRQVIGELSLLAGTPRSASVRAVRESELLRIEGDDFRDLLQRHPAFLLALSATLALRLQQSGPLVEPPPAVQLLTVAYLDPRLRLLLPPDALGAAFGAHVLEAPDEGRSAGAALDEAERQADVVLLVVDAGADDAWTRFCIRHSDGILAVVGRDTPPPDVRLHRLLAGCELVLVGAPSAWPDAGALIDAFAAQTHHFASAEDPESLARLVRRTTGASLGVVLSGGGARCFAHIGVLDVLRERGLVVDRAGGTSMGAFLAALAARGATPDELLDLCRDEFVRRNPFSDYRLPRVSLIRGARGGAMLRRVFGHLRLEQLPRDAYAVSADLIAAESVVHRRGEIAFAVGASMSLPGIAPPVPDGPRLHVDGGVLNNLPVDVMAARPEGPIVAVNAMRPMQSGEEFGPETPGRLPSIVETLTRSASLGSWLLAARSAPQASCVVAPPLVGIGTLDWRKLDRIVEAGREAAAAALDASPLSAPRARASRAPARR